MRHDKISLRPTAEDLRNLDAIADNLRVTTGRSFLTRTAAIRAALAHAAGQQAPTANGLMALETVTDV